MKVMVNSKDTRKTRKVSVDTISIPELASHNVTRIAKRESGNLTIPSLATQSKRKSSTAVWKIAALFVQL